MKKLDLNKREGRHGRPGDDEKPKGPRQRALLTVEELKLHHRLKSDLETQIARAPNQWKKKELARQLANVCREMHEHWRTMPRNPVEDYSGFPRT